MKTIGESVPSRFRPLLAALIAAAATLVLAACGDDSSDSSSSGELIEGGEITTAQTSQPDYLDPALSYTVNGWEPMWIVYTPLLTYAHEEGEAGARAHPGPGGGPPRGLRGRLDLHLPAS